VAIGVPPAVILASYFSAPPEVSELGIAGALMGEPLEVVKCETSDLVVPAYTEIVIEGKIDLDAKFNEGPITEVGGYYIGRKIPVTRVTAICHRSNPIFHAVLAGHRPGHESIYYIKETLITFNPRKYSQLVLRALKSKFPNVRAVATAGYGAMQHLIISIDKKDEGEPEKIIRAAFSININGQPVSNLTKRITVVDAEDIDIRDLHEVEWAINSRLQNESRIIVIPNVKSPLERAAKPDGTSVRLGIDATIPQITKEILKERGDYLTWVPDSLKLKHGTVPGIGDIDLDDYLT